MATEILQSVTLRIHLEQGFNAKGEVIVFKKNFTNIHTEATPEHLLATAQSIAGLQNYPLLDVVRVDSSMVTA